MKSKKNPGKSVSVYWVLENADTPPGLKFVLDPRDKKNNIIYYAQQNECALTNYVQN